MEPDGLRFRQVVAIEDDDQTVSSPPPSSSGAAIHSGDCPLPPLTPKAGDPGHSRTSAREVHWTSPPPHPSHSSPNHWENAISVYDRSLEERNSPSNPLTPSPSRDGAPGQVTGPPPSRASLDSEADPVTGDHPSPYDADEAIKERQRIFGHNIFPPHLSENHPSKIHLVPKEINLAIVSTCRLSIHSDPPIQRRRSLGSMVGCGSTFSHLRLLSGLWNNPFCRRHST